MLSDMNSQELLLWSRMLNAKMENRLEKEQKLSGGSGVYGAVDNWKVVWQSEMTTRKASMEKKKKKIM